MDSDSKDHTLIGMDHGKKIRPVIADTLKKHGFDPKQHAFVGKDLYALLSEEKEFYKKLLDFVVNVESDVIQGKTKI